ncbi:hypothetical protein SprV_0100348600 [Sparganum proliferum]
MMSFEDSPHESIPAAELLQRVELYHADEDAGYQAEFEALPYGHTPVTASTGGLNQLRVSECASPHTLTRLRWPDGSPPRYLRDEIPPATSQKATRQVIPQQPVRVGGRESSASRPLTLAAWNVRSPLDNPRSNRPERRTALMTRELARYKLDIAALSETRFSQQHQLGDVGAGYTFWSGRPRADRRNAGIAFATRNGIVGRLPFAAGYQRSLDEPRPASPERRIRHHRQFLRSHDSPP